MRVETSGNMEAICETQPTKSKREQPLTDEEWDSAKARKLSGQTWAVIAEDLGVPSPTLRTRWARENMPSLEKKLATEKALVPQRKLVQMEETIEELGSRLKELLARDAMVTAARLTQEYSPNNLRDEETLESVKGGLTKRAAMLCGWESASSTVQVQVGVIASLPDRPASDIEA